MNLPPVILQKSKGTGWSLVLSSIDITRGVVTYVDVLSNRIIEAQEINQHIRYRGRKITISGSENVYIKKTKIMPELTIKIENNLEYDTLDKSLTINKSTVAYGPVQLKLDGSVEKMETLHVNADLNIHDLAKLIPFIPEEFRPERLSGSVETKFSLLGSIKEPQLDGDAEFKNCAVALKGMTKAIDKINGNVSFTQNAIHTIILNGVVGHSKFSVHGSITNLKKPILDITTKIDGDLNDLESLTKETQGTKMAGPFSVNLTARGTTDNPTYSGTFTISNAQIDGVGLASSMKNLQMRGTFQKDGAKIDECSGNIGRSDFSLTGQVSDFKKPIIQINNKSQLIDLDELLPKPQQGGKKDTGKALPITLLGTIRIKKLIGLDMEFMNINTNFKYENGIIDLKKCSAETFDGKVNFDFYYNSKKPEPYRISTRMNSISAKAILKRFLKFEHIEGRLYGMSNFQGNGFTRKEVTSNLSASGNLEINNGVFRNFQFLIKLLSWLGLKDYKEVKFDNMICNFKIDNGRGQIKDWTLSSSIGDFLTNGTIGLDGKLNLMVTSTLKKNQSNIVKKYHGDWLFPFDKNGRAIIDVIVSGTLSSPQFNLDRDKIKKRLEGKIKDEFENKKKEWGNKLKDLFGR
ncbi:hypothetical protein AMJ52_02935 [candidate division TA06 bacterium DG_78]|uniref:AsmA domain-containing protein n=1 Tax=candidate division TA06 bacterium DG_78 TaxID=1703772 RepID=A0A0S7YGD6_UNCT6|nr:MAG: hypothetical protein AMJ52_02935 [candidate division TA06 bacterium DG_78]